MLRLLLAIFLLTHTTLYAQFSVNCSNQIITNVSGFMTFTLAGAPPTCNANLTTNSTTNSSTSNSSTPTPVNVSGFADGLDYDIVSECTNNFTTCNNTAGLFCKTNPSMCLTLAARCNRTLYRCTEQAGLKIRRPLSCFQADAAWATFNGGITIVIGAVVASLLLAAIPTVMRSIGAAECCPECLATAIKKVFPDAKPPPPTQPITLMITTPGTTNPPAIGMALPSANEPIAVSTTSPSATTAAEAVAAKAQELSPLAAPVLSIISEVFAKATMIITSTVTAISVYNLYTYYSNANNLQETCEFDQSDLIPWR